MTINKLDSAVALLTLLNTRLRHKLYAVKSIKGHRHTVRGGKNSKNRTSLCVSCTLYTSMPPNF